jgi:RNA polymerase sigma-70 factor (ECF subfamily)
VESFDEFYVRFRGPVLGFFARRVGEPEVAADLMAETFARALVRYRKVPPDTPEAWLFTIARNLLIDGWRAEAARPRLAPLGETDVALGVDEVDRALEAWQMAEALRRLSPEHRAVIVETYYGARSVAATAARLGIPEGTVKSRLYYGLRALRLVLEEFEVVS